MKRELRLLSLCSGIGGIDLAAEQTGHIEIAGQVENDPFCQQVLAKHWPNVKRLSDIKDVIGNEFGAVDIVAGGIPCQPFSRAGQRRGTEDDRHLWPYAFPIIKVAKPAWVLVENVAGFVEMALDLVATDLEGEGYEVQAFVLPAAAVEAPHERLRCFVLAYSDRNRQRIRQNQQEQQSECSSSTDIGINGTQGVVANSTGRRQRQHHPTGTTRWTQHYALQPGAGNTQSRMDRDADGSPYRLDRHQWPALPGQQQHPYEPARTVTERIPNRGKRLKALGNAVVPQIVAPLFALIIEAERQTQN